MTSSQINVQNYCTKRTWTSFMPLSLLFSWHNLLMETAKVVICNNFHAINKNWTVSDDSIQILEEILEWFINAKHYLKSRTDFVKKKDSNLGSSYIYSNPDCHNIILNCWLSIAWRISPFWLPVGIIHLLQKKEKKII